MKKFILLLALLVSQAALASSTYLLPTKIGEKVFDDVLVIEQENPMMGTLTVPGVFTAPIVEGNIKYYWSRTLIHFTIKVKENGEEYLVKYKLYYYNDSESLIQGELFLSDGTKLGEVINGKIL